MLSRIPFLVCALGFSALLAACAGPSLRLATPKAASSKAEALVVDAERALREGRPERAAETAKKALAVDPQLASAHALLAELALLRDDGAARREHWLAALEDGRSGMTPLYLQELRRWTWDREEREKLLSLLEDIVARHQNPRARASARLAAFQLARSLGRRSQAETLAQGAALLRRFRAIAGFDNNQSGGYDTPYGPEREIALAQTYPTSRGRAAWRVLHSADYGPSLLLGNHFYPFSWNIAYLLSYVRIAGQGVVPATGAGKPRSAPQTHPEVILEVRTSEPVKVWINDRNVLATRELRGDPRLPLRVKVRLAPGFNKLLVKSAQRRGPWRLALRFTDAQGRPLAMEQSVDIKPYEKDRRPPLAGLKVKDDVERDLRGAPKSEAARSYWRAVALAQRGLRRAALAQLRRHLLRWPRDPLALLRAAWLHRQAGQNQASAMRVFMGLRSAKAYRARFLVERAHILRRRGQLDRALALLDKQGKAKAAPLDAGREAWISALDRLLSAKGWQLDRCDLARKLTAARPKWAWARSLWASCTGNLGRPKASRRHLRALLKLAPGASSYRGRLARAELALGRCSRAISLQKGTLRLFPGRRYTATRLGDMYRRCRKPDKALESYAAVAKAIPDWGRPQRQMGLIHYEAGRRKEAIAAWRRSLALNPNDSSLWDRIERLSPSKDDVLEQLRPGPRAIMEAIRAARRTRPVPGASVVWLLDDEASRLMPDGTFKRIVTVVRMAVDRAGRDSLGETRLPRSGLVKVLDAYAVDRRGRRREVTSMHGRRVRYPKLAEGSVVVLQYRHIRHPGGYLRQHLATSWYFQHPLGQVRRARWALALPSERKLNLALHGPVQHRADKRGAVTVHTFAAHDVPPLRPEARSLPARDLLASATVSTVPSWDYFSSWGRSLTNEVFEMTPALTKKLKEISSGAGSVAEKVRRVYGYALANVRYQQDYETFIAGVKPHAASVVLARGYGDCKDKSVLMIAMLRALGIEAHFALIRTRRVGKVHGKVPSQQFNHAVVYLPAQKGVAKARFLDATAENLDIDTLRGDVQGTKALVLVGGGHRLIEVRYQAPRFNRMEMELALKLDAQGAAHGNLLVRAAGHQAGMMRKPLANQQILRQYAQSLVHRVYPGATLKDARAQNQRTVLKPLVLQISADYADAARDEDGTLRLRVPKLFSWASLARWTERRHPVFFGAPMTSSARLVLQLPAGARLRSKPADLTVQGPCLKIRARWTFEAQSRSLRYDQKVDRLCHQVSAKDYPAFRGRILDVERSLQREVVIVPAGGKKARKASKGRAVEGKRKATKRKRKTKRRRASKGGS